MSRNFCHGEPRSSSLLMIHYKIFWVQNRCKLHWQGSVCFQYTAEPIEVKYKLDSFISSDHSASFSMLIRVPQVFKNISLFPFNGKMRTIPGAILLRNAGESHCVDGTSLFASF